MSDIKNLFTDLEYLDQRYALAVFNEKVVRTDLLEKLVQLRIRENENVIN